MVKIKNVSYLPYPNNISFVETIDSPPEKLTTTAFVVAFDGDSVVVADNAKRGLELPGGHIEMHENAFDAARRECHEETGFILGPLMPFGYIRMEIEGACPDGWKYPYPISYQQYFLATVIGNVPFESTDECNKPLLINPDMEDRLTPQDMDIISYARNLKKQIDW